MSQPLKAAETYELIYQASNSINFAAFDYRSVKQSLIDYIRIYHAEAFSDFIESSELVAIIESFAYVCELVSYRLDMNAHENTMDSARRKDMVLKLARMACYNASRVNAASGLVKIDSISTTEKLVDSKGKSLANVTIKWNDASNPIWKEQFITIFNRLSRDNFGTVSPQRRVQIGSVLYELYDTIFSVGEKGVIPFNVSSNGKNIGYEIVPADLSVSGPIERRPSSGSVFSLLYAEDGLGDNSEYTGLFMLIKQGTLFRTMHTLNSVIDNQMITIDKENINNTDVWLNQIVNGNVVEWMDDTSIDTNIAYSPYGDRNRYTIDTLQGDRVRLVFGNDEFSNKPNGSFELWYRVSDAEPVYVPKTSVLRKVATFTYNDASGRIQTATLTYSLVESIQNGSKSESIEHIKKHAPLVYASQNRMVSARDYNAYPLKDPSILKVKTVNRTFAGDSLIKTAISEPSGTYDSVRIFNTDGTVYEDVIYNTIKVSTSYTSSYVVSNELESTLSQIPLLHLLVQTGRMSNATLRTRFSDTEKSTIVNMFDQVTPPWPIGIRYVNGVWVPTRNDTGSDWDIIVDVTAGSEYRITTKGYELVFSSNNVTFYTATDGSKVFDVITSKAQMDTVKLLKANTVYRDTEQMFNAERTYRVLNNRRLLTGLYDNGKYDGSKLTITVNNDAGEFVPSNISQYDIFDQILTVEAGPQVHTVNPYAIGTNSIECESNFSEPGYTIIAIDGTGYVTVQLNGVSCRGAGQILEQGGLYFYVRTANVDVATGTAILGLDVPSVPSVYTISPFSSVQLGSVVPIGIVSTTVYTNALVPTTLRVKSYVYLDIVDGNTRVRGTDAMEQWAIQNGDHPIRRVCGRGDFNFVWNHVVADSIIVNPSPTNIQDMFVVTNGYMDNIDRWLNGELSAKPAAPSTLQLHNTYVNILSKAMMSDSVIMKSGNIKILFGSKSSEELQAMFYVVRNPVTKKTDNAIKREITEAVKTFFSVDNIEFGKTFFFSELEAHVMTSVNDISAFALVPTYDGFKYGDLQQILAREDEILYGHIESSDIAIVPSITPYILKR